MALIPRLISILLICISTSSERKVPSVEHFSSNTQKVPAFLETLYNKTRDVIEESEGRNCRRKCPPKWIWYNGFCYSSFSHGNEHIFDEANAFCHQQLSGAGMAKLSNPEELHYFKEIIRKTTANEHQLFWVGIKSVKRHPFKWSLDDTQLLEGIFNDSIIAHSLHVDCSESGECCPTINRNGFLNAESCSIRAGMICRVDDNNIDNAVWQRLVKDEKEFFNSVIALQNQTEQMIEVFGDHVTRLKVYLDQDKSTKYPVVFGILTGFLVGWNLMISGYLVRGIVRRQNQRGSRTLVKTPNYYNSSVNRSYAKDEEDKEKKVPIVISSS